MSTPEQQHLALARLLELSELMLSNAINGVWETVFELQALRDGLIRDFFAESLTLEPNLIALSIEQILECDKQLVIDAAEEKKTLQKQIISIKQSKSVEKAYSNP